MDFKSSSRRRPHVNVFGCCQKHVNTTQFWLPHFRRWEKSPHCAVSQILDFVDIFEFGELLLTKKKHGQHFTINKLNLELTPVYILPLVVHALSVVALSPTSGPCPRVCGPQTLASEDLLDTSCVNKRKCPFFN